MDQRQHVITSVKRRTVQSQDPVTRIEDLIGPTTRLDAHDLSHHLRSQDVVLRMAQSNQHGSALAPLQQLIVVLH